MYHLLMWQIVKQFINNNVSGTFPDGFFGETVRVEIFSPEGEKKRAGR